MPPREGVGRHVWNLASQLTEQGHEIGIVTRGSAKPTVREIQSGITIWRVPFLPTYPAHVHIHGWFVNRIMRQLAQRFDLINAHTPLPPALRTDLPVVTTVHSLMRADTAATPGRSARVLALRAQSPVSERVESALLRRSQGVTASARWVADALRGYGVDPQEVAITGNGVESCFLGPVKRAAERDQIVLFVGRLQIGKGLGELVEAAKLLVGPAAGDVRFVIAGSGPLQARTERLTTRAGVRSRFEFVGHVGSSCREELADLYRRALIFVLPSYHEGMPTVLLEAMACGAPVVATAVGGSREVVEDGVNGLLVPPRDPPALARAIGRLLSDAQLRHSLGERARGTVAQEHSWVAIGQRYTACYGELV
jgi:glycosyltransferase involved in cell wall biosynthesis